MANNQVNVTVRATIAPDYLLDQKKITVHDTPTKNNFTPP